MELSDILLVQVCSIHWEARCPFLMCWPWLWSRGQWQHHSPASGVIHYSSTQENLCLGRQSQYHLEHLEKKLEGSPQRYCGQGCAYPAWLNTPQMWISYILMSRAYRTDCSPSMAISMVCLFYPDPHDMLYNRCCQFILKEHLEAP